MPDPITRPPIEEIRNRDFDDFNRGYGDRQDLVAWIDWLERAVMLELTDTQEDQIKTAIESARKEQGNG